jgi:hypothetical protein
MSKFKNFMKRSSGEWISHRRYFYTKNNKITNLTSDLKVDFVSENDDDTFQVNLNWTTYNENEIESEGEMITIGNQNTLRRNVGYFSDQETLCQVTMIDGDCAVFNTSYNGMRFREEIRLLEQDTIRIRTTLGFKDTETVPFLCGQYLEMRK